VSNFLVYNKITDTTGIKLAEDLGIESGLRVPETRFDTLIRWGDGQRVRYNPRQTLNSREALEKAVNKHRATQLFAQNGVRVPPEVRDRQVPCVGRSSFHTQGQNFWLCWISDQISTAREEGAEYFIKYIPIKQEWRVHVIAGEVAFVQRKYNQDRVCTGFMGIQGFRNHWHKQVLSPQEAGDAVCEQGIKAVQALGLDFGGVDVIISIEDNLPYVLEVNSGPALPTTETRLPYVTFFKSRMER